MFYWLLPQLSHQSRMEATPGKTQEASSLLILLTGLLVPVILACIFFLGNELKSFTLVLACLALGLTLARPFWGLLVFIGLIFVRPEDAIPSLAGLQITLAVAVATLAGLWCRLFVHREAMVKTPAIGMLLGFFVMTVISTISGGDFVQAALDNSKLVILILLLLNLVRTPENYQTLIKILILFTGYLAADAIYRYYTGAVLVDGIPRAVGTGLYNNPNDLAVALIPGLTLALLQLSRSGLLARVGYLLLASTIMWALFLTNSRGGLLALMVIVGGYLYLLQRHKGRALLLACLCVLALLSLASARMKNFDIRESSANSRIDCWSNGIMLLVQHPLTGIGYNQFRYWNEGMNGHSIFVVCFTELGLPGYFFWMGCLYYSFRRRPSEDPNRVLDEKAARDLAGIRLMLAGYLVASAFGNQTYMPLTYILIALPLAQQIATSRSPVLFTLSSVERFRDCIYIGTICVLSILAIKLLIPFAA